jgi:hypothetical protein
MARTIIFRAMYEYGQEDTAGEGGAIWICFLGVDVFDAMVRSLHA